MPKYGRIGPYHIYFWSYDRVERPHVHVTREKYEAKYWIDNIQLASNKGFKGHELRKIQRILEEEHHEILAFWNDYFKD